MLLFLGLFTFIACSEDVAPEATDTKQDEGMAPPTIDPLTGYESPYDIAIAGTPIQYIINNGSPFEIVLTPYVGLAYSDGIDDGNYDYVIVQGTSLDLTNGNYDNIYNGREYLNLIEGVPINLAAYSDLDASSEYHCPTIDTNGVLYDIIGAGATVEEAILLRDFGKIYYYKLDVIDVNAGLIYSNFFRNPFNSPTPGAPWSNLGVSTIFGDEVFEHSTTAEIVCANTTTISEDVFNHLGNNYYINFLSDANIITFAVQP